MAIDPAKAPERRLLGRRALLLGLGAAATFAATPSWAAQRAERIARLYCPETDERFEDVYWADGTYLPDAFKRIDWLMRDFHCDAVAEIDPSLVDLLHAIGGGLGGRPISILSGFRTPGTNRELRHEGMPAASRSQHLIARAADIAVEGVGVGRLHRLASHLKRGGVGGYDHYIHVDTGPPRDWSYHPHHL